MYQNKIVTDTVCHIMLLVSLHLEISTTQCLIWTAKGQVTWVMFLVGAEILLFSSTQTKGGAFLASYPVGTF